MMRRAGGVARRFRNCCMVVALPWLAAMAPPAEAGCALSKIAELPVTMTGLRPLVPARINGRDAMLLADSGAFFNIMSEASATQYELKLHRPPSNLHLEGIGGKVDTSVVTIEKFSVAGKNFPPTDFIVGGSDLGGGVVGVIGQNLLGMADAEYDFAHGAIRLMQPGDGCEKTMLAYWSGTQAVSGMDIEWTNGHPKHTIGTVEVNGTKIRAIFDTGAPLSILDLAAARRAGITPEGKGAFAAGTVTGFGSKSAQSWVVPIASLKVGDEAISNTKLRIGEIDLRDGEMLIGADFFLSHRVYVANGQSRMYFTYIGGPVFDLARRPGGLAQETPPVEPEEPTDAAGFGRRGAAYAARRDFPHAISDLTRACELDPHEPRYFIERGLAFEGSGQAQSADDDFGRALALKPDDADTLLARARLYRAQGKLSGARADLEAADGIVPKESSLRLPIARGFVAADDLERAVADFDLWISAHPFDGSMADAKNGRCWARALLGKDLERALDDCDDAVALRPYSAEILDSRGLVQLRLGKYDKAIADYDESLKNNPKRAWSLYGRGLAKSHKGLTAEAKADIDAAIAVRANIADEAGKHGIGP